MKGRWVELIGGRRHEQRAGETQAVGQGVKAAGSRAAAAACEAGLDIDGMRGPVKGRPWWKRW